MLRRCGVLIGLCLLLGIASAPDVFAQAASSHYQLYESQVGAGGLPSSSSTNYQGAVSVGDVGVGDATGTNFQVKGGSQTTADPALSFTINSSSVSFTNFTTSAPSMATASFSVINYTSYGYIVLVSGSSPTNGSHSISPMATAGTSSPGFEQYGINLVANTSPQNIGANPNQGQFGFGIAATGYDTANNYKYVDGDTIASAPKSSGQTDFTISYLVNVGSLTPGGQYTSNQQLIVVGTY